MLGSPRTSSSLDLRRVPSPLHAGQAPKGELNEKWRGSSSGIEMPQAGQPYFSLNSCVSLPSPSRPCAMTCTSPSARRRAVSSESVSRAAIVACAP